MSLNRRLCRLESGSGGGCAECGGPRKDAMEDYEVVWEDSEEAEPSGPEYCAACGRQTTFIVGWDDLEEMEPNGVPGIPGRGEVGS